MRRRTPAGRQTPLDETTTLLLLLGEDAPGIGAMQRLMFTSEGNTRTVAQMWKTHVQYLLAEARRRRIERPRDPDVGGPAFFGERAAWLVAKCERFRG